MSWLGRLFSSKTVEASDGTININGKTYRGNNVAIINGRVLIDGKEVSNQSPGPRIDIVVHGNLETLQVDCCDKVKVDGSVGSLSTVSGDVSCGDVSGDISAVSGDVACGNVQGNISTVSGDIRRR